jgi:hypothetical protein
MLRARAGKSLRAGRSVAMADYQFEREARTPYSEAYVVERDGDALGRVDLHFTAAGTVYATLCVPAGMEDDDVEDLIADVDERLVLTTDPWRDDFVVTVWRGEFAGEFSEDEDDDEDEEAGENGREPAG